MGNNYNIKFNPQEPSRKDIEQYKDFDALLEQFQQSQERPKTARIRSLYVWSSAVAAALIGAVFFFNYYNTGHTPLNEDAYFEAQAYVQPPIEDFQPDFNIQNLQANQGGIYEYESGSRLIVPAEAFMDDYGNLIEGEVEIQYRELYDYVDFFLAGIPMAYDSLGRKYQLESAGMIEIFATQDGKPITMAPGKTIQVELVSAINIPNPNSPPQFNIYKLDVANRNWAFQNVDHLELLEESALDQKDPLYYEKASYLQQLQQIETATQQALSALENSYPKPVAPQKPQAYDNSAPTIELDFLENVLNGGKDEFSDLKARFGDIIWQIAPSSPAYDQRAFDVVWQSATLEPINELDYQLTLIHGNNRVPLHVRPVLMGEEYETAVNTYQKNLEAYQLAMIEWNAQIADEKKRIVQDGAAQKEAAKVKLEEALANLQSSNAAKNADTDIRRKVINRFEVNSFGIWNCAQPTTNTYRPLRVSFKDNSGASYEEHTGYLVDKKQNTIYRFLATDGATLHFNANSTHLLWIITDDNQIAIMRPEDFDQINTEKNTQTLELTKLNLPSKSEQQIREQLSF